MFERFTSESRQVLVRAEAAATRHGEGYLGPEHLLLALLDDLSVRTLIQLSAADPDRIKSAMLELTKPAAEPRPDRPVFAPEAKQVLELSLRETLDAEDRLIRPRHVLLGVLREGKGPAAEVLAEAGVTIEGVRSFTDMTDVVSGRRRRRPHERVHDVWDFRTVAPPPVASPGATRVPLLASELAGGGPVSTVHFLRALLTEQNGLAARVLERLGVTEEKVDTVAEELGVEGTSDEGPEERRAREVRIKLGTGREVTIDDEDVARQLHELAAEGDDAVRDALRRLTEE